MSHVDSFVYNHNEHYIVCTSVKPQVLFYMCCATIVKQPPQCAVLTEDPPALYMQEEPQHCYQISSNVTSTTLVNLLLMLRVLTPRVCIYHTHDLNSLWYTEQHQRYPVVGTFALFFSYSHKPRRSHIRVPIINIQPEAAITCNWYETLIKMSRDKYCWAQIWDATASTATFSFDYELQRQRAVSAPATPILQHESHTIAYNNITRTATSDPIPIRTLEF